MRRSTSQPRVRTTEKPHARHTRRSAQLLGLRGWNAAVAVSTLIVVAGILAMGIGWLASAHTRSTRYTMPGGVTQVDLDLVSGEAVISGSSASSLEVRRTDRYAFGRSAIERRYVSGGVLHISSRCPKIVLGSCSASYQLAVPENMAVHVKTNSGAVRITGFRGNAVVTTRSGDIDVEAYCGFDLAATSDSGNLHVATACAPEDVDLQTGSGDAVALVPPGRYQITAHTVTGSRRVTGVTADPSAPFTIQARSTSGDVAVEGGV